MVRVEVVYATPARQQICRLLLPAGSHARQAVQAAKFSGSFAELDLSCCALGVFGKRLKNPEAHVLQEGERVEIYRPLLLDPKEIRRRRAAKAV